MYTKVGHPAFALVLAYKAVLVSTGLYLKY